MPAVVPEAGEVRAALARMHITDLRGLSIILAAVIAARAQGDALRVPVQVEIVEDDGLLTLCLTPDVDADV